jgi:hypothetical protein
VDGAAPLDKPRGTSLPSPAKRNYPLILIEVFGARFIARRVFGPDQEL